MSLAVAANMLAGLLISGCQNNAQFKPDSQVAASAEKANTSLFAEATSAQPKPEQISPAADLWTVTRDNLGLEYIPLSISSR